MTQPTKEEQIQSLVVEACATRPNLKGYECAHCPFNEPVFTKEQVDRFEHYKKLGLVNSERDIIIWPRLCEVMRCPTMLRHSRKYEINYMLKKLKRYLLYVKGVEY